MHKLQNETSSKKISSTGLNIISVILSVLVSLGVCISNNVYTPSEKKSEQLLNGISVFLWKLTKSYTSSGFLMLFIAILMFFAIRYLLPLTNKKAFKYTITLSYIFSFFFVLADSYYSGNNWNKVFGSADAFILSLIKIIGIAIIAFFVLDLLFRTDITMESSTDSKIFCKRFFLLMGVILLCWLPYFIFNYPGVFVHDACDEIAQATNQRFGCGTINRTMNPDSTMLWNNHHPVFYTAVLWFFVKFGRLIGSYTISFFIYCLLQAIAMSGVFAYTLMYMNTHGLSRKLSKAMLLFFALNPLFPLWCTTITKDTPFTIIFLLCTILLYDAVIYPDKLSIKKCLVTGCALLLLCMLRNNGFYLLLVLLPFLLFTIRKNKKQVLKLLIVIAAPLLFFKIIYSSLIFNALGIQGGSIAEMLSVPFQQTARYISEYPEDVTSEEEAAILSMFTVDSLSELSDLYNPIISDPVKAQYNKYSTGNDKLSYIKVWGRQLIRHPDAYLEAFFNMTYGWFNYDSPRDYPFYTSGDELIEDLLPGISTANPFTGYRNTVQQFLNMIFEMPVISFIFKYSSYTWLLFCLLFVMLHRHKYRELAGCGLIYLNYLICFIGPVSCFRYALPMIVCLPFVIFAALNRKTQTENKLLDGE
ncbi:MAG: DUF6020 family protein [Coprococcus sp.]